jgi:hypothetical protein
MQTVRITRGATLEFVPGLLELGMTRATRWPFFCVEITDGWLRVRLFRSTVTLASSRRVGVNPDIFFGTRETHNLLFFDARTAGKSEGESYSWRLPADLESTHHILLQINNDDRFREVAAALRQAGFTLVLGARP